MARNAVQFQKGLSEAEFDGLYGTEEQCRAVVIKLRWPNGFSCPVCGGTSSDQLRKFLSSPLPANIGTATDGQTFDAISAGEAT